MGKKSKPVYFMFLFLLGHSDSCLSFLILNKMLKKESVGSTSQENQDYLCYWAPLIWPYWYLSYFQEHVRGCFLHWDHFIAGFYHWSRKGNGGTLWYFWECSQIWCLLEYNGNSNCHGFCFFKGIISCIYNVVVYDMYLTLYLIIIITANGIFATWLIFFKIVETKT